MLNIIANLLTAIGKAALLLGQFLTILFLGLLTAFLYALPWLLRMACVLIWLMGAYMAMQSIQVLYAPHSPTGAVLALQFAVIFLMVAWVGAVLLTNFQYIWGGLGLSGLLSASIVWGCIPWLQAYWQYADLFFRVLPPALFSLALIYITIRMRILRKNQSLHLAQPAFTWLPDTLSKIRGHHE